MIRFPAAMLGLLAGIAVSAWAQGPERDMAEAERVFRKLLAIESPGVSLDEIDTSKLDLRQLVDYVLVVRLSKELGLTEDEAARVMKRIGVYKDEIQKLKWQRGATLHYMNEDIKNGAPEETIRAKLNAVLEQDKQIRQLMEKIIEEAGKELSVAQTAKLYLFLGSFESEILALLRKAEQIASSKRESARPETVEPPSRPRQDAPGGAVHPRPRPR